MINDVKWIQAQRHASDWRRAGYRRPLITFGAAAPAARTVLLRTPLNGGHIILSRRGFALYANQRQGAEPQSNQRHYVSNAGRFRQCGLRSHLAVALRQRHEMPARYSHHSTHQPVTDSPKSVAMLQDAPK